jgi:hypothetical protein
MGEYQDDGFSLPVNLIGLLAVTVLIPGGFILDEDSF